MDAITVQTVQDLKHETTLPRKRKYTSKACVACRKQKIRCMEQVADDGSLSCKRCIRAKAPCSWPEVDARKWGRARSHRRSDASLNRAGTDLSQTLSYRAATANEFDEIAPAETSASTAVPAISAQANSMPDTVTDEEPYTKLQYYRYLGSTAIAPGYKKITLKATSDGARPSSEAYDISDGPGASIFDPVTNMPVAELLPHLLDAFFEYHSSVFCFLNRRQLESLIAVNQVSRFLLCSLAALSARFCKPEIFEPFFTAALIQDDERWRYSLPFLLEAKRLLMPLLSIPSCDLIAGLLFLALAEFGDNNEAGMWIFTGMSMRVAQELGLHRHRPAVHGGGDLFHIQNLTEADSLVQVTSIGGSHTSAVFDESAEILLFWCCYVQDICLANGTGRVPSIRESEISVRMPTKDDIDGVRGVESVHEHVFPTMVRMMTIYARSIDYLNLADRPAAGSFSQKQHDIGTMHDIRDQLLKAYEELPDCARYGVRQYQHASKNQDATSWLLLHLQLHLQVAFLTQACQSTELHLPRSSLDQPRDDTQSVPQAVHDSETLTLENKLYRNAIKSIVDILTIARFVDTRPLVSTFFLNQPLFHAACAYAGDMLRFQPHTSQQFSLQDHIAAFPLPSPLSTSVVFDLDELQSSGGLRSNLSTTDGYLSLLAKTNYQFLRQSITEMAKFYAGAGWVDAVLDQRESGIRDVDLSIVSDSICTYVRLHDLRASHRAASKSTETQQISDTNVFSPGGLMLTDDLLSGIPADFDSQAFFNEYIFADE